jgi:ParB/RepB/Spo0J family partition protein
MSPETKYDVVDLPINEIFPDPDFNCRGEIIPLNVLDLAKSIRDRGLDTPITVQPFNKPPFKWRIIAGHRRHMAFQINNQEKIPCFIREGLDETKARTFNLVENLQRENLNILQEANALKYFFNIKAFNDGDIATMFGQSRGWVQIRRDLLKLPPDIQKEAAAGVLNQNHIKLMARMKNTDELYELTRKIKDMKLRGEKVSLSPSVTRPSDAFNSKNRTRAEIVEMLTIIYNITGPDLHTRCLAWATGEISTVALMSDVKDYCEDHKITYKQPDFMRKALAGDRKDTAPVLAQV